MIVTRWLTKVERDSARSMQTTMEAVVTALMSITVPGGMLPTATLQTWTGDITEGRSLLQLILAASFGDIGKETGTLSGNPKWRYGQCRPKSIFYVPAHGSWFLYWKLHMPTVQFIVIVIYCSNYCFYFKIQLSQSYFNHLNGVYYFRMIMYIP